MRKRRRLADKLTIMVCAVLVAVSAFFYAPMDVCASSGSGGSIVYGDSQEVTIPIDAFFEYRQGEYYKAADSRAFYISGTVRFSKIVNDLFNLESGKYYKFTQTNVSWSESPYVTSNWGYGVYNPNLASDGSTYYELPSDQNIFLYEGQNLKYGVSWHQKIGFFPTKDADGYYCCGVGTVKSGYTGSVVLKCQEVIVTGENEDLFNQGYDVGYNEGESVGYGNGYSQGFADGEASVDTDAIYDEAFQAGKDSVDTQSYYDAGYQAGYDAAYSAGYESGYDVGYQSAMDRIENWGADTSDYPLQISSGSDNGYFSVHVGSDIPFNYRDSVSWRNSNAYNPNHTYKYVINFSNLDVGLNSDILYDFWSLYLNIGGIEYNIFPFPDSSVTVFIPGDRMTTSYSFDWVLYNCANFVSGDSNLAYVYVDYDFVIYDMGPSGDTQNHIANQTDQLTNGFDESQGDSVNSDLSSGLNEYQTAEDSLWATATTGLKDFTFFDFESVPAMITGMSFITSIMGSWFSYAGGASGVGIVLSILFSVMVVAMVLGLYRLYQSKGGKK